MVHVVRREEHDAIKKAWMLLVGGSAMNERRGDEILVGCGGWRNGQDVVAEGGSERPLTKRSIEMMISPNEKA